MGLERKFKVPTSKEKTNMLQFKIPQCWMMKYCGISRWISSNALFPFYCVKQFLAGNTCRITTQQIKYQATEINKKKKVLTRRI